MNNKTKIEITSFSLHIMAMLFMLCDHLWGTVVTGNDWLNCVGRISFPIFAFMIVEGYFHTGNLKKYVLRMLLFAVISEIPFNLAIGGRLFFPIHQNVLWSFLLSIALIYWNEKARFSGNGVKRVAVACISVVTGCVLGLVTMVDYYHAGILTVLVFYYLRGEKWWCYFGQLACLWYINTELLGGIGYDIDLFGHTVFVLRQSLALLALVPIWLYRGKQGYHNKFLQYFYYAFYPLHLLVLGIINYL